MVEANAAVYAPFPAFADWVSEGLETEDLDRYANLLAEAKAGANQVVLASALEAAQRYAAVDTNAIEGIYEVDRGFTRTVATQAAAWEAMMDARGAHVRPAFDDALNGYEYVLDAATGQVEITENWIRDIHTIICKSQDTYRVYTPAGPQEQPFAKGVYKTMPNSPTLLDGRVHAYAPVLDTAPEMQRLIGELRSPLFLDAHPVLQASYAHYAYVCIHPFADGNGRVARSLSSVFLYRNPGLPLIVFADQRNEYYDALSEADSGNPMVFVRFIATQTIDAMNLVRTLLTNTAPPLQDTLSNLNQLFSSDSVDAELIAAGVRLRNMVMNEAKRQVSKLSIPDGLSVVTTRNRHLGGPTPPRGYEDVGDEGAWGFVAKCERPVRLHVSMPICTFFKSSEESLAELTMCSRADDQLEVWMREITPAATEMLKLKIAAWCEVRIAEFLARIQGEVLARRGSEL